MCNLFHRIALRSEEMKNGDTKYRISYILYPCQSWYYAFFGELNIQPQNPS